MARLNIERQEKLTPVRIQKAIDELTKIGIKLEYQDDTEIWFYWKGSRVKFWPYSGWHSGRSIKDGRGLKELIKQLKNK